MNIRLSSGLSNLTKLFRILSLGQFQNAVVTLEELGSGRKRWTLSCCLQPNLCQLPAKPDYLHDEKPKGVFFTFSAWSCHFYETVDYKLLPACSPALTCPVRRIRQHQTHKTCLSKTRHLHTSTTFCISKTGSALQRRSTQAGSKKRIPLSHTQEIEEVLTEHADDILEYTAALGCNEAAMRDMVRHDTRLVTTFDKEAVIAKMRLLMDYGFTVPEILSRYQVFSRSYHHLQSRLKAMEPVRHYKHGVVYLLLSDTDFRTRLSIFQKEVSIMGNHSSQASFVAELLDCTEEEIRTLASNKQLEFLLTRPPSRLRDIVAILRSFGVSLVDMRTKCLMLRCAPELARDRLQRVSDAGIFNMQLVPYILTNSDKHFNSSFATWVRNAKALGDRANEQELLMDKLQCSEEDVQLLMRRHWMIASLKSGKLAQCLDILLNEVGMSSKMILRQGNLLYHSPRRLQARWVLLKPLNLSESALAREFLLPEQKFVAKYGFGSD